MTVDRSENRFPYQDPHLPTDQRVSDLLSRLTLDDKAGLLFLAITTGGDPDLTDDITGFPSLNSMIIDQRITHFALIGEVNSLRDFVAWQNAAQVVAASQPLSIPVTFATDPRHGFAENPAASSAAGFLSQWPEPIGLAALRSEELVEKFADIARREYLAIGIRMGLHPQIDLATEPRWSRSIGTFGEDAELTSRLVRAYIRGFKAGDIQGDSVSLVAKHFPGGGPQKDGEDPHFPYGREQIYPGDNFDYHLAPFRAALDAGITQIMPYYGMPVGTDWEEVGFNFNRGIVTGLLREQLGFEGIVLTDFGILTDVTLLGWPFPARAWGVEELTRGERMLKALDAGIDQFGGEYATDVMLELVRTGRLDEGRLDESVRRVLTEKFRLGLFENAIVDLRDAELTVGQADFVRSGRDAQSSSVTVLTNASIGGPALLPLSPDIALYLDGMSAESLPLGARAVERPEDADVAILRVRAPFDTSRTKGFESLLHAGSLDFASDEVDRISRICELVPTVLDVYLERPAILTPFIDRATAIVGNYGCSDAALLDALFGRVMPKGRLPYDLPRSMSAVEESRSDVPFDTVDPLFVFGHGLDISRPETSAG